MLEERRLDWWEQWKQEGLREGLQEGRREGMIEGTARGKRLGILEGEARVLHRLLERRFAPLPAWIEAGLVQATEEDLVRWSELTLDPSLSLEDVFRV